MCHDVDCHSPRLFSTRAGLRRQSNHSCVLEHVSARVHVFKWKSTASSPCEIFKCLLLQFSSLWGQVSWGRPCHALALYGWWRADTRSVHGVALQSRGGHRHHGDAFPQGTQWDHVLLLFFFFCLFVCCCCCFLFFTTVLWWYFQLPCFILPLLNGNNDIQLFYSSRLDCETGGRWCSSWQPHLKMTSGEKTALSAPKRLMIIGAGNLCYFTAPSRCYGNKLHL